MMIEERFAGPELSSNGCVSKGTAMRRCWSLALVFVCSLGVTTPSVALAAPGDGPRIEHVAGGSPSVVLGAPALASIVRSPTSVAFDAEGNLLIVADGRLLRVEAGADGLVTGSADPNDELIYPDYESLVAHQALVVRDADVFVADWSSGVVVKITQNAAGEYSSATDFLTADDVGLPGFSASGLAIDSSGNLYVSDRNNQTVFKVDPDDPDRVVTVAVTHVDTGERVGAILAMAFDGSDNLFMADRSNHVVLMRPAGEVTPRVIVGEFGQPGDDLERLNTPQGVAVAADGSLYIADTENDRVLVGTPTEGSYDLVSITGLEIPNGMAFDASGNLFVAELGGNSVRLINFADNPIVAGSVEVDRDGLSAASFPFNQPNDLAFDHDGIYYVAAIFSNKVYRVDPDGRTYTAAGGGESAVPAYPGSIPALDASLTLVMQVLLDGQGNLYITEWPGRVSKIDSTGQMSKVADFNGNAFGLAYDGRNLFVADWQQHVIRKIAPADGAVEGDFTDASITIIAGVEGQQRGSGEIEEGQTQTLLNHPSALNFDNDGNLLVTERTSGDAGIHRLSTTGGGEAYTIETVWAQPEAAAVAVDASGDIYAGFRQNPDFGHRVVRRIERVENGEVVVDGEVVAGNGTSGSSGDGGSATEAELMQPSGLTFDADGNLWIVDRGAHRIRMVDLGHAPPVRWVDASADEGGDGSEARPFTAIQQALESLPESGTALVRVMPGTYSGDRLH